MALSAGLKRQEAWTFARRALRVLVKSIVSLLIAVVLAGFVADYVSTPLAERECIRKNCVRTILGENDLVPSEEASIQLGYFLGSFALLFLVFLPLAFWSVGRVFGMLFDSSSQS